MGGDDMKHTLVALVENKPGVLNRVASMFRRRNFNIDSLSVGTTESNEVSRMTIVVEGDEQTVDQAVKQMYKLVNVIQVLDVTHLPTVNRELALIKVATTKETRGEIMQLVNIYRANIIDVAMDSMVIQITGQEDKVDSIIRLLRQFGIKELARTGRVSMMRGVAD
jgi:acetolactate synthase-1/3 small subunit